MLGRTFGSTLVLLLATVLVVLASGDARPGDTSGLAGATAITCDGEDDGPPHQDLVWGCPVEPVGLAPRHESRASTSPTPPPARRSRPFVLAARPRSPPSLG